MGNDDPDREKQRDSANRDLAASARNDLDDDSRRFQPTPEWTRSFARRPGLSALTGQEDLSERCPGVLARIDRLEKGVAVPGETRYEYACKRIGKK